jgi:hypothetical protein
VPPRPNSPRKSSWREGLAWTARVEVIEIIEGITRVILHFGFMQYPTIAEGLALASSQGKLPGISATSPITEL